MKISPPKDSELNINPLQLRYIQTVSGDNALASMKENLQIIVDFFKNLPEDKLYFRYAEGKWTPIEILGHIIDTERILAYRALSLARNEKQALLGFEEDDYVKATNFNKKSLRSLLLQYKTQRKSTILLFSSFSNRELNRVGKANGYPSSAKTMAWILAGHELHHLNILKERYL